jgi:hypothetical protein
MAHRVVSYNLLSPQPDLADFYGTCDPADLKLETRLVRIQAKLQAEMASGAIIGLQEVSREFAFSLGQFFRDQDYQLVMGLHSGNMGVMVAVPPKYEVVAKRQEVLSKTQQWPNGKTRAGGPRTSNGAAVRQGDWHCPNCKDHQFARNQFCRRCQTPKPRALSSHLQPPKSQNGAGKNDSYMGALQSLMREHGASTWKALQPKVKQNLIAEQQNKMRGEPAGGAGGGGKGKGKGKGGKGAPRPYAEGPVTFDQGPATTAPHLIEWSEKVRAFAAAVNTSSATVDGKGKDAAAADAATSGTDGTSTAAVASTGADAADSNAVATSAAVGIADDEWVLPADLDSDTRKHVHAIAEELGLAHVSTGEGSERRMVLRRQRGGGKGGGTGGAGGVGGAAGGTAGGTVGGSGGRPGDWICPRADCGDLVFARNNRCRVCGEMKPGLSDEAKAMMPPPLDIYDQAKEKQNMIAWVHLRCVESGDEFCFSTYHMPCEFRRPKIMTMHAMAVVRVALQWSCKTVVPKDVEVAEAEAGWEVVGAGGAVVGAVAGAGGAEAGGAEAGAGGAAVTVALPCILAGDFNFRPDYPPYRLLTTGCSSEPGTAAPSRTSDADGMDTTATEAGDPSSAWADDLGKTWSEHTALPVPEYDPGYVFDLTLPRPVYSAYTRSTGKEPDFTNSAETTHSLKPEPEEFIGTLDYIFCSEDVEVVEVLPLPSLADAVAMPTATEPSDHLLIAATVKISRPMSDEA